MNNGKVTLEGVVANQADVGIEAQGVPGVFSVTNHLRVDLMTPLRGASLSELRDGRRQGTSLSCIRSIASYSALANNVG